MEIGNHGCHFDPWNGLFDMTTGYNGKFCFGRRDFCSTTASVMASCGKKGAKKCKRSRPMVRPSQKNRIIVPANLPFKVQPVINRNNRMLLR